MRLVKKISLGFVAGVHWASRSMYTFCIVALFVMMVTIVYDVLMRYIFRDPTSWSLEMNELLLCFFFFLTVAEVARTRRHIRMDLFFNRMSKRVQTCIELVSQVLLLAAFAVVAWKGVELVEVVYSQGIRTGSGLFPYFIPYLAIPIGTGVFCLICLFRIIENLHHIAGGTTKGQRSNT